jgi:hypothetical protein
MDDNLRFFFTGDPMKELGVSPPTDECLPKDALFSTVGDLTLTVSNALSIGCKMERLLWGTGLVSSFGEDGDRRFLLIRSSASSSDDRGESSICKDAFIGGVATRGVSGESSVDISVTTTLSLTP